VNHKLVSIQIILKPYWYTKWSI